MKMLFDHPFKEELIKPVSPESPLIQLKENQDSNFFEAIFYLELAGVTYLASDFEKTENRKSEKEAVRTLHHNALVAGMSTRKELNFIYRGGIDSAGRDYFNWEIMGRSTGETSKEALNYINQLWQDVYVFLKAEKKGYHFAPLTSFPELEKKEIKNAWQVDIKPSGIAINGAGQRKIGYAADADYLNGSENVVIIPNITGFMIKDFDSFAVGVHGCPGAVMLMLSIKPMNLSEEELRSVAIARELLRSASSEQIRYRRDVGVENEDVLTRLKHYSELWLENPAGYRITCTAISDKAIPESFLSMVGSEVFHGCAVTFAVKKGKADNKFLLQNKTSTNAEILDLRGCINSASALPPLFPKISILSDSGIKRFYTCPSRINLSQTGIILGQTDANQSVREVRVSRADRSRHTYLLGSTGVGKSSLLYNMIRQDIANGESVTLIDPHGDLYNQVLRSVPERRKKDLVLIDPSVVGHSVGINFLECNEQNTPVEMNFIVNEIIKIFDRLYDLRQTGGPLFEQYMRNALLLVMDNEHPGATLVDIPMIFEDSDYRGFLLSKCKNPFVESFWSRQAEEAGGDISMRNIAPYITSKLNQFTTNALIRPIIGQSRSTINFREIMDEGKILLVNLSKGFLGEMDTQLLGMLIIGKIFSAAMSRINTPAEKRRPMFLYVDEFQNFTTDTVAHLLSEARKFGINLILANQNLSQLTTNKGSHNIMDSVLGNAGNMFVFRLGAVDAEKMQTYTRPELLAQDLQELPDFHVAGRLLIHNTPSKPFVFKTLPRLNIGNNLDVSSAVNASMTKYSRSTKEVEDEINRRRTSYKELSCISDVFGA